LVTNKEIAMSLCARVFVDYWIDENVEPEIYNEAHHRSREYAARCLRAAKDRGISSAEIMDEIGNLSAYIAGISDRATDRRTVHQTDMHRI
jgi:hypothetical protein